MLRSLILKTLITNSGVTFLGLVNSVLLSRWLGPAGRGEIAAAMLWPTMLVYLSSMGLITATLYFAALPDSRPRAVFNNAVWLGLAQSMAAMLLGFAALPWLLSQNTDVIFAGRVYMLVIPLSLGALYGASVLQGLMRISMYNWLRLIVPTGYLIGTIVFMMAGRLALLNILLLHMCLNGAVIVATLTALSRSGVRLSFGIDLSLAKQMIRYGAKVQIGNVTGLANLNLDQALMAAWLPLRYLGLYVVAVSAANLSHIFAQAVLTVLTPSITQKKSPAERIAVLQGAFRRYWLVSLLISLTIAAALPVAIPVAFGASFKEALWPAEVLLLGGVFISAKEVLSCGAQALGDPWLGSKAQIVAVVVTVVLLWILLPSMGILGAAIATAAAYLTQLVVVAYGLRKGHGVSLARLFRFGWQDLLSALNVFQLIKNPREHLTPDHG